MIKRDRKGSFDFNGIQNKLTKFNGFSGIQRYLTKSNGNIQKYEFEFNLLASAESNIIFWNTIELYKFESNSMKPNLIHKNELI